MNLKYARCGMYNGSTLIVQHTHSTLEREGMMAFAQRWIDLLAPGCDGEVRVESSLYDRKEFMHQNINTFTNLVVLRDNIQLQLHLRDGAWPESGHDRFALTLLNADHEPLHTWQAAADVPLQQQIVQLALRHIKNTEEDRAWRACTPTQVVCMRNGKPAFHADIALTCQYRVDDPF